MNEFMKMEEPLEQDKFFEQKDFNFSEIFKFAKLNFKFIIPITILSFILSAIHSLRIKPTWQGEFQVVLQSKGESLNPFENLRDLRDLDVGGQQVNKTEIEILKSPSVMEDVFNFYKDLTEDKNKNKDKSNELTYKLWLKSKLDIKPIKKTSVLTIKYQDENKSIIIPILNLISTKYQNYPNSERNKSISNVIDYLKTQIESKSLESKKSLIKLQQFSFDNSLGEFDGMFPTEINKIDNEERRFSRNGSLLSSRYASQFGELELAESELLTKSVYYKENSPEIIFLKKRINQLKKSLERPKEILIEYRSLSRKAQRDELLLSKLEGQLTLKEIEREQEKVPYKLITKPTLDELQIAPKKKQIVLFWTSFAFLGSLLITLWRASNSELILSKSSFDNLIPLKFLKKIQINDEEIDTYFLDVIGKNCFKEKTKSYNLIVIDEDLDNYYSKFCDQLSRHINQKNISIRNDLSKIANDDINYLIVKTFSTKRSQIYNFLEDISLLNIKISGWFLIDNE